MGKMILRYWLKFSLHTARGVHESSIESRGRLFAGAACRAVFPLCSSTALVIILCLQPQDTQTRRRKYENIARLVSEGL